MRLTPVCRSSAVGVLPGCGVPCCGVGLSVQVLFSSTPFSSEGPRGCRCLISSALVWHHLGAECRGGQQAGFGVWKRCWCGDMGVLEQSKAAAPPPLCSILHPGTRMCPAGGVTWDAGTKAEPLVVENDGIVDKSFVFWSELSDKAGHPCCPLGSPCCGVRVGSAVGVGTFEWPQCKLGLKGTSSPTLRARRMQPRTNTLQ